MKTFTFRILAKLYLLILCALSILSCAKDKIGTTRYVEGKVLEYGTEKPVANARVVLLEARGEFLGPSYKVIVDSTFTDEKGYYRFQYIKYPGSNFVSASSDQYFKSEDYFVLDQKKSKTDIYLDPHAWLKVKVEKEGEIVPGDGFTMETFDYCDPRSIRLDRGEFYCLCKLRGNRSHDLNYYRLPGGGQLYGRESLSAYLPGHDTTEYVIQF